MRCIVLTVFVFLACSDLYAQKLIDADKMLFHVNQARSKACVCGDDTRESAPPLAWDKALARAALKHANDMARRKFFSHTGSDKSTVVVRVERERFKWNAVGENIAMGYKNEEDAVAGWMTSPGHCKNIMNPEFTRIGAAVSRDGKYWVQVFGREVND